MKKVYGTIVMDEIIFRIVGIRLGRHEGRACFLLDAETERGSVNFPGGDAECTVFGENGLEMFSLRMPNVRAFWTQDGTAYMTFPIHITEVVGTSP